MYESHSFLLDVLEKAHRRGATWGQIAGRLGVTPRAVHLWRQGGKINAKNRGNILAQLMPGYEGPHIEYEMESHKSIGKSRRCKIWRKPTALN